MEQQVGLKYSSNDHVLKMRGFMDLRANMGFEQMRFYCHKKIPRKSFHVATKGNSLGEAMVQYFIGNTTTPPQACDLFSTFPDDNSTLSLKCADWGTLQFPDIWGIDNSYALIMSHRLVWRATPQENYFVAMCSDNYFCEDFAKQGSLGDKCKVYIR